MRERKNTSEVTSIGSDMQCRSREAIVTVTTINRETPKVMEEARL